MDPTFDPPRTVGSLRIAAVVGLVYLAVGAAWIWTSDRLVAAISTEPGWLVEAQRGKGLVYIVVTTLGLVWLVHRGYQRLLAMQERVAHTDLRVRDLFENHPQPMWVYDLETYRFLRVNDAAMVAYGWRRDEFLAMTAKDIRPEAEVASFLAAARLHGAGTGSPGIFRHRRRNGQTLLVRISEHRVELDGRPAMMVMAEDVTEEVGLQDAVDRQQRQFRQLLQSLGEVLWMAAPDFSAVMYVSPAFETIYGRRPDELVADPDLWRRAVHPDDAHKIVDLRALLASTDSVASEYRIVRPDGSIRWIEDRKRLIRDEAGAVVMVGGIAEDITARRERDEARDALASRMEALVADRTSELQQANIELEAFSRTAAHDLKSPLNGIVGMSQLLRLKAGPALDGTGLRYLDQIERSARDMAVLINDLLALSRAGSVPLQREEVDLAPLVLAQVEQLRLLDPLRRVSLEVPQALPVHGDPGLLRSVVQNLVGNAWKFSGGRDEAHITVSVAREAGETRLTVADDGVGFDTSGVGELLRPFQRFHTQAQFQGTGLGLVTCQRIAHRHGGRLVLQSAPGAGTRVSVVLPA